MFKIRVSFAIAAALFSYAVSATHTRQLLQTGNCPTSPTTSKLDFSSIAAGCKSTEAICSTCLCPLLTTFSPALAAGGITLDTASSTTTLTEAASLLTACVSAYIVPITAAGVDIIKLSGIQSCPITVAAAKSCLGAASTPVTAVAVAAGNSTVMPGTSSAAVAVISNASLSTAASPSPTGNNTVRINPGSIEITATGPTFTISGAVTNPADLLKLMISNKDLTSALEPAELTLLKSLYTQMSAVSPTPKVQRAFAGLVDTSQPINAVELLTSVQDLLSNLEDEEDLVAATNANSTLLGNSTSSANGTLVNDTAINPDTIFIPAPTTSSLGLSSSAQLLNPVRTSSGAAAASVTAAAAAAVLFMVILL